ncbi:MAG TPA: LytTR family DNA-binding domain-containing protein [Tissierellaceae bacterium]|nr:LytTR family DNA-binding domain-containing protein [Tissierellaceae bacterium]
MIRCIVVDDEKPAREELAWMISRRGDFQVAATAENGIEALEKSWQTGAQLVFLDINMPGISGVQVAQELAKRENPPYIVFVTAYDKYAIKAFEVNAVDYLLKPVSEERLEKSLEKIKRIIDQRNLLETEKIDNIIKEMGMGRPSRIVGYRNEKLIPIETREILFISIEDKTTYVHTSKGRFTINSTLSEIYDRLKGEAFFRSHKSYILNLDLIESIEPWFNSTYNVRYKGIKEGIPVSRTYAREFRERMNMDL